MKTFKIIITTIILVILIIVGLFQYKVESYRIKQIKRYEILKDKTRLSYQPALFYYLFNRKERNRRAFLMPYAEKNIPEFFAGAYDDYIVSCYYTDKEIDAYIKTCREYKKENR